MLPPYFKYENVQAITSCVLIQKGNRYLVLIKNIHMLRKIMVVLELLT